MIFLFYQIRKEMQNQRAIESAKADIPTEAVTLDAVRRSWLARPLSKDVALVGWHNEIMLP